MKIASKKSSLSAALKGPKAKVDPIMDPAPSNGAKVMIAAHFAPEVKTALAMCRIKLGNATLQHVMGLAFNKFCADLGVPEAYSE